MTEIQILSKQTEDAYGWTNKLIDTVPIEKWDEIAIGLASNISWQVGHLIASTYYHTIMTTVGHIPEIIKSTKIPFYSQLCGYDTHAKDMVAKTNPEELKKHLILMQEGSLEVINSLSENELWRPLEPTKMPHPVAKNKFEAIDWNIKHTMWHCGQLAIINRIVHKSHDFGIQKNK